ncbi:Hypothetical protein NTJ_00018 [Nesidiocoris tenuis]|uniref:Uncharacterized protein n=1 Tax=Nesidiocoris tenuis TaxID=355587 RepID=A0ABN7A5R9_9HEMI|nr:Hypothetical protein NTJ_00018 [Nesidiocoris tenuis]
MEKKGDRMQLDLILEPHLNQENKESLLDRGLQGLRQLIAEKTAAELHWNEKFALQNPGEIMKENLNGKTLKAVDNLIGGEMKYDAKSEKLDLSMNGGQAKTAMIGSLLICGAQIAECLPMNEIAYKSDVWENIGQTNAREP